MALYQFNVRDDACMVGIVLVIVIVLAIVAVVFVRGAVIDGCYGCCRHGSIIDAIDGSVAITPSPLFW